MMLFFYKDFSRPAGRALKTAVKLAGQQGFASAHTGHLLLALLRQHGSAAAEFLHNRNISEGAVRQLVRQEGANRPRHLNRHDVSPELTRAMEFARLGAHSSHSRKAGTEHLLCALLEDDQCTAGVWMRGLGLELPQAARECRLLTGQLVLPGPPRAVARTGSRPSDKYGRDLTRMAQEGELDPVLCRESELARMEEILCRRRKNNPCLVGEPGVGKTALAEALAQRIASGRAAAALCGRRVLALDMAAIVAGTKYRGDFEERFRNLLEELQRDKNTILFIDEIHVVVGAGAAEGAIDAASILKPMLARGELQVIGATTQEEYRTVIQKDAALERRFGRVWVEEPTPEAAEQILTGLMPRYERFHRVSIPPETIRAAVELSVRYLPGRFLPDKAIDLLDEAAASLRIQPPPVPDGVFKSLTPAHVAAVVSRASGVPAERITEQQRERLALLESRMEQQVVGQQKAVQAVAGAIRRSRTGLREAGRPIGSMLFLGPSGVGKTHLARTLARCWFGTEKALLRFDMSEYMEQHTVARLIGAPPGYLGHEEGGQLTEAVRRRPYSVVLFDEIEKAHGDIQNILLQILEDGCLTDSLGRKTDFSNTVVLLTSNLGARCLAGQKAAMGFGGCEDDFARQQQKALEEARAYFRPELLGRMDEVVVFRSLQQNDLAAIAEQLLCQLEERAEKSGYHLQHEPALPGVLAQNTRQIYGARELRRRVTKAVEQALADKIAEGAPAPGTVFTACSSENGGISLKCEQMETV